MIDKITIKLTYGWCPSLHRDGDGYDGWTADIEILEEGEDETEIKGFLNASDDLSPESSDAIQQIIKAGYERLKKM